MRKDFWSCQTCLYYTNKSMKSHLTETWSLPFFGKLIVFLTQINLPFLLYLVVLRCAVARNSCIQKCFFRALILMTLVSPYLISLLELMWNWILLVNSRIFVRGVWLNPMIVPSVAWKIFEKVVNKSCWLTQRFGLFLISIISSWPLFQF